MTKIRLTAFPLIIIALSLFPLMGCKKQIISNNNSVFLPVEERNSSLLFHYSSTALNASGSTGYNAFVNYLTNYDSTEVLGTMTLGNVGGANNDTLFTAFAQQFGILAVPYFQTNLDSAIVATRIAAHRASPVVAGMNYNLVFDSTLTKITINTTTQFFQESVGEDFYLSAYLMVDSLVAPQAGHPDSPLTNHRKVVVDAGRIPGYDVRYLGYKVAGGTINAGYRFNLTFTVDRLPQWTDEKDISVALVLTRRDGAGKPIFVNAHTHKQP